MAEVVSMPVESMAASVVEGSNCRIINFRHQHIRDLGDSGAVCEVLERRIVRQPFELQHLPQFGGRFEELDQSPVAGLEVSPQDQTSQKLRLREFLLAVLGGIGLQVFGRKPQ